VGLPVPPEPPGSRPPGDPVLGAQLAHARLCRLIRNAEAAGVERRASARVERLTHVAERHLLVALADLPQRLDTHVGDPAQQRRAVTDLADLADGWDHPLRPVVVGEPVRSVHGARLLLADAVRVVLRNGLARLGASAPERM
jgi:arginyl-tRNA synthetase